MRTRCWALQAARRRCVLAVVPAGVGHCNEGKSADLLIVGAYPDNTERRDLRRGKAAEHDEVVRNIAAVKPPAADPVSGSAGPLMRIWVGRSPDQ